MPKAATILKLMSLLAGKSLADNYYYDDMDRFYLSKDFYMKSYRDSDDFYKIIVWMPKDGYLALSFGGSHINADMFVFMTDSFSGTYEAYDMYSTEKGEPVLNAV